MIVATMRPRYGSCDHLPTTATPPRSLISAICISMGWVSARTVPKGLSGIASQPGQGNVKAQFLLGAIYGYGKGVPQNYAEAAKWYRLEAGQGHVIAQYFLGRLYEQVKNYAEAAKWYRYSADKGYVDAQVSLGGMYDFGRGVPKITLKRPSGIAVQRGRAMPSPSPPRLDIL